MNNQDKVTTARVKMKEYGVDAYIFPSSDAHQSEYVADHWASRAWISGFDGSAGTAVITHDQAGLWTDSRYFLQAEMQLGDGPFSLQRLKVQTAAEYLDWLKSQLSEGQKVGFDGNLVSLTHYRDIQEELIEDGIEIDHDLDLIDLIYADRPPIPTTPIFEHHIDVAVMSRSEKIAAVRSHLKDSAAEYILVSALDNLAWTLNIRGKDIACNPVTIAYLIISQSETILFVDDIKLNDELKSVLTKDGISLRDYTDIRSYLSHLDAASTILIDPNTTSIQVYNSISTDNIIEESNIIMKLKAVKSPGEITHIRNAMVKDGIALTRTFKWLEETVSTRSIPEVELAAKLAECRSDQKGYHQESFDAIVGYRGNGAIIHYHARPSTCADIENEGMLLVDSGGQYEDGTTDITRTFCFSDPTAEQRKAYTCVLKGMVDLSMAVFPIGTMGVQLDILARQHLWSAGLNFGHGTGHGVGYFLNVHEPPQGITPVLGQRGSTKMVQGMLTSNEPGYYKEGEYGIRIENLVVNQKAHVADGFLEFETLTLYPFEHKLIDKSMLSDAEIKWINDYHQRVYEQLSSGLNSEEQSWFKNKCADI